MIKIINAIRKKSNKLIYLWSKYIKIAIIKKKYNINKENKRNIINL